MIGNLLTLLTLIGSTVAALAWWQASLQREWLVRIRVENEENHFAGR